MARFALAIILGFVVSLGVARAQPNSATTDEKGTYLGVLISSVPEVLYDQVPDLPRGQGVLVTHILPDSPAAKASLRRNDVLLEYDDTKIRDGEHFARLIQNDKPDRKVKLSLVRGGRSMTADVTLELGIPLRIVQNAKPAVPQPDNSPRGTAKTGSPPAVSVSATPLEGGRLKIAVEYYQDDTNRLKTVEYEGTIAEIESQIRNLPPRVTNYTNLALRRIKELEFVPRESKDRR
jgi:membrane-associated protease RseP (regulator of RpoE activity)